MALPWQADFVDCAAFWWPSQRPVNVVTQQGKQEEWARGMTGFQRARQLIMVKFWSSLAHVLREPDGRFIEVGRKPINGFT